MKVLFPWLKEFVDFDFGPDETAEKLTMLGLETNVLRGAGERGAALTSIENVVVAKIEKIEKHPMADKLTLCRVRAKDGEEPIPIVCGAPNIKEGDVVPLALPGAVLPGGMKVEKARIRGEVSFGMMCSEKELGISEDHSGIMILAPDLKLGKPIGEALGAGEEVLELDLTPNRGDALSVTGVARELAALLDVPLRYPEFAPVEEGPDINSLAEVIIEDFDGCPRYAARLVQGIKTGPSPDWMRKRLEAGGIRAINNVVDVTNYILLELGQPLHAFDFKALRRSKIVVRCAEAGEKFTTLDGEERTLFPDSLLICDGEGPVALAGVMGGLESEVIESTTDVLIESAFFNPVSIRRTSQKLGLSTEASHRFERTVDPLGQARAADRAAKLMAEICGGKVCKGLIDAKSGPYENKKIYFRSSEVYRHLGINLDIEECAGFLRRLEMNVKREGDRLLVELPSFRPDLQQEIDLVEEIARLYGYDRIEATLPGFMMEPLRRSGFEDMRRQWSDLLVDLGFTEVVNCNFDSIQDLDRLFIPEGHRLRNVVKILNPLSEQESVLRYSLLPRLLNNLNFNLSRDIDTVRIFEFNKVFAPGEGELLDETNMLAGIVSRGDEKTLWSLGCPEDGFYEIKGVVETLLDRLNFPGARLEPLGTGKGVQCSFILPGKGVRVMVGKNLCGFSGKLHPDVQEKFELKQKAFIFELNFDMLTGAARDTDRLGMPARYPGVKRDIALVVDEDVSADDVLRLIGKMGSDLMESAELFDVYRGDSIGKGRKSMAFRIRYQSHERTLTDEEVNALHAKVSRKLVEKLKAKVR